MRRIDFRLHLLLAAGLPSILMAIALGLFWWNWTLQTLEASLRERVEATAKQVATAAELPMFSGDLKGLQDLVDALAEQDSDLTGVTITDHRGAALVNHGSAGMLFGGLPTSLAWHKEADATTWRLALPIQIGDVTFGDLPAETARPSSPQVKQPLGYVVLDVSLARLHASRDKMISIGLSVIGLAIVLSVVLMVWLAAGVTRPLARIIRGVETMAAGDLAARIDGIQSRVFQPLAENINKLAEGMQLSQNELEQRIEAATLELRAAKIIAEQEARLDPLTGLANRRAFMERASDELLRARRYNTPLSLAMIDIDHFKNINDRWGHAVGDQVLMAFADTLKRSMRDVDIVARIGGEEFVLLMTHTSTDEAVLVAERIRQDIEAFGLQMAEIRLNWTASFGVTGVHGDDYSVSAALVRADDALYRAKSNGRNRVEVSRHGGGTAVGNA
jgi:diguanylate cyclase (GGDEF)-like protein